MDHTECIRHLAALDTIRFIELLPGNRYRIKVCPPVFAGVQAVRSSSFFKRLIADEFLTADFREASLSCVFLHGFLSELGREELIAAVDRIAVTLRDLSRT